MNKVNDNLKRVSTIKAKDKNVSESFKKEEFFFFLYNKNIFLALEYLKKYPDKIKLYEKYYKLFIKKKLSYKYKYYNNKEKDKFIDEVLSSYAQYYLDYFTNVLESDINLFTNLSKVLDKYSISHNEAISYNLDAIEKRLESVFNSKGYYFLGGKIDGVYGPIIWKYSEVVFYDVAIPYDKIKIKVIFIDKFISKGWLDYISFGKIGLKYWVTNDKIYVLKSEFKNQINNPKFQVSLLKYYAQYKYDINTYGKMEEKDLLYRAKLVELIYYPNISKLKSMFSYQNDCNNYPSSYAAFCILKNLSEKIFGCNYVVNENRFNGKTKEVAKYAKILLDEHTDKINQIYYDVIDVI